MSIIRNWFLLFIGISIIISCSKRADHAVIWRPMSPKAGEEITIVFYPQRLVSTDQERHKIFLVYQLLREKQVETFKIPMVAKKQYWQARVQTNPEHYLLRLKFEDQNDRVEDNDGLGWNIMVRDVDGKIARNTHYELGLIYGQEQGPDFIPNYTKADHEFQQELTLFPDNFKVWFDLWKTRLNLTNWSTKEVNQTASQLDSLLKSSQPNADLLALAHHTNLRLLNNLNSAIRYGEALLTKYENYPNKDEIEYSMIFLKNGGNVDAIHSALIKFAQQGTDPTYLKSAYYQSGISFQQRQNLDESIKCFRKYLELEPNDIQIRLKLANLYIKQQNYESAQQMINEVRSKSTDEFYFQINPWEDPARRREAVKVEQCQILSTQAALASARQNYQSAIEYRKQVIEGGTPFPAFEWEKIGDIYFQLGKLDSAEQAYIKAVSINSAQADATNKLRIIYQLKKGNQINFDNYLSTAIEEELKALAKLAPDFELTDLEGEVLKLSDQKGKIVLLTFWDSWSTACQQEIPQLNTLVDEFQKSAGVVFWAISVEAPVSINNFIKGTPFKYHIFHSGFETKKLFNVIGFPTHIMVDQTGKIRYTHIGYSPDIGIQLKKEMQQLLREGKIIS